MVDEVLAELRELRARVEALEVDNTRLREAAADALAPQGADVPVDRRHLLKLAGKTAVVGTGLAAGAALLGAQPAAANHLPGFGHFNDQNTETTVLISDSNGPGLTVNNTVGEAISGTGRVGVSGYSSAHRGVQGGSDTGTGVYAYGLRSNAITAQISDRYPNGFNAVYATTAGTGNGVFGEVTNTSGPGNAVLGIHRGPGNSVFGFKPGGAAGDAVVGYSQTANSRGCWA